ncbi:hypothetical protein ACFLUN_00415 [Chloroflexota bacterium]
MMIKVKCPKCQTDGSISIAELNYKGPYRCWKCRELFTIELANNELKSCEPLSQEEFDKQQELESLKAKFKQQ